MSTTPDDVRRAAVLATSAAHARGQFSGGRNGRLSEDGAVHLVELRDWPLGGFTVPSPACHVGSDGWDFTRLRPTHDEVTCGRCARLGQHRAAPPFVGRGRQLALDLDALPSDPHTAPDESGEDHDS